MFQGCAELDGEPPVGDENDANHTLTRRRMMRRTIKLQS
jgi:hypothetical protein